MRQLSFSQIVSILALGLVGWVLCGGIMFVGMAFASLETTLILHAVGAPIIFSTISWFYFRNLRYIPPAQTAVVFLLVVIFLDFFVVALVINHSLEMFQSLLGTWIPFALIFLSTYVVGLLVEGQRETPRTAR